MLSRHLLLSATAVLAMAAASVPAWADWHGEGDWGGDRWRDHARHEWREHHDRGDWNRPGPYQPWVYAAPPPVYYQPPPPAYAPPPAYYQPPPGVSFGFGW